MTPQQDILIIGSGAAGLALALCVADQARVTLLSKGDLEAGSSQHAQGGIAAVLSQTDEAIHSHIQDTLETGAGLCDSDIVSFTVTQAKAAIEWLIHHGVQFTLESNSQQPHLTQEGGHSQRRILHAADKTGAVVVKTLLEQVQAHPNITCVSEHTAIDLLIADSICHGAVALNNQTGDIIPFYAKHTVLACGGASSIYRHTTNPDFTSGDGMAMAHRAGCRLKHMEFNQFHPTKFYGSDTPPFLISEALRGEGAKLRLPDGTAFIHRYDARAELAPRDIVARAIHYELQKNGVDYVYLDITHQSSNMIRQFFPTINAFCLSQGIDITKDPIPVVPAAHYTCGGVVTNRHGQTDVPYLYAIGEVACTGLHGANRMASNSLLECLVFAASAAKTILTEPRVEPLQCDIFYTTPSAHCTPSAQSWDAEIQRIKTTMWKHAGVIRSHEGLKQAYADIQSLHKKAETAYQTQAKTKALIEFRNMVCVSQKVIEHARARKENIGLHYNRNTNQ